MKLRLKNPLPVDALALVLLLVAITPSFAASQGSSGNGAGAAVYKARCVTCHGQDGGGTAVGKSLQAADLRSAEVQKKSDAELTESISEGKGNMPAFKGTISDDEIHAVVTYVRTLASKADSTPKKKSGN